MSTLEINKICEQYYIENFTINDDGSIDVDSDVYIPELKLDRLPLYFRRVSGSFYCDRSSLKTFERFPKSIGGFLSVEYNEITSLMNFPLYVGGDVYLKGNKLPNEISKINKAYLYLIIKHQVDYKIWNFDETLNLNRLNILLEDIKKYDLL